MYFDDQNLILTQKSDKKRCSAKVSRPVDVKEHRRLQCRNLWVYIKPLNAILQRPKVQVNFCHFGSATNARSLGKGGGNTC